MNDNKLFVASSPHVHSPFTTRRIMAYVIAALAPAGLAGIYFFGFRSLIVIIACIAACVLSEYLWQKLMHQASSIKDLSAVVTGLLLAYNLPPTIPIWMAICGSVFAIIIVKQFYGGIGCNIVNPALAARAMMLISWPIAMTTWTLNGVSGATELAMMKLGTAAISQATADPSAAAAAPDLFKMFIGNMPGCIGETSSLLLILGGVFLIYKGIISWRIPVIYILTASILAPLFGHGSGSLITVLYEIVTGGLLLGAFFMATDYTTSPMYAQGQIIFAFGCGLLTALIRTWGGYPEGVSFSILIMNITVPLIDQYTKRRVLGEPKSKSKLKKLLKFKFKKEFKSELNTEKGAAK
ncbi:MAG: RnfABCDGE type electron transport complex subunit D [Synergistaceae bacterium]|nr:RnfABCDGE type electron transport complex subunit D [Synergistaceae bacterium]